MGKRELKYGKIRGWLCRLVLKDANALPDNYFIMGNLQWLKTKKAYTGMYARERFYDKIDVIAVRQSLPVTRYNGQSKMFPYIVGLHSIVISFDFMSLLQVGIKKISFLLQINNWHFVTLLYPNPFNFLFHFQWLEFIESTCMR